MGKTNIGKLLSHKKLGVGGIVGLSMNVYGFVDDYKSQRQEGHGKAISTLTAAGNAAIFEAVGFKGMLGLGALKHGPEMIVNGVMKANSIAREMDSSTRNTPFINSTFADSNQAYTMRQAGMQLAQASKYNLQQTLMGNEASSMHRL